MQALEDSHQKTDQPASSVEIVAAPAHHRIDNGIFCFAVERQDDDESTLTSNAYDDNQFSFDPRVPTWSIPRTALAIRSLAALAIFVILLATPSSRVVRLAGNPASAASKLAMRGDAKKDSVGPNKRSQSSRRNARGKSSKIRPSAKILASVSAGTGKRAGY
jgi:hypothetical protein